MKLLQIASGDFFSTYGGGQVYVKNIVDEMIRQGLDVSVLSFVSKNIAVVEHDYKGISLWEIGRQAHPSDIGELVRSISPNIIHAHSQKALFATMGERLHIPVVITVHHAGILCPAGALMNADECICQTTISHDHCLKCCLANIRTGRSWYPLMKLLPKKGYMQLGKALEKLPFIPFISPIGGVALSIESKIKEWQTICDKATKVIAPSNAIAEAMCRNGLSRDKVEVIPHGIPKDSPNHLSFSERLKPSELLGRTEVLAVANDACSRRPPNLGGQRGMKALVATTEALASQRSILVEGESLLTHNDKIRFFYVGRICRIKGLHILLEAFNNLAHADRAELHIIGGAGNKGEQRYMEQLQQQYRAANIVWHGKVPAEKVFETIKEYDVMVHPTICMEIFGLNIAEALAMNKPVLATRCGGAEMQIQEGMNGWLVPPNDVFALRAKMNEIVYQGIAMDGSTLYKDVIAIDEHVKDLLQMYEKEASIN